MSVPAQSAHRLGLADVPGEISKIFFGKDTPSGRPRYSDWYQPSSAGYGASHRLYLGEQDKFSSAILSSNV